MTHFLELLFEAGIAVTGATLSAFPVMAFHFLGTSAESMRFIGKPGLLKVHGRGHEMRNGIGSTVFTLWFFTAGHVFVWSVFTATVFTATAFSRWARSAFGLLPGGSFFGTRFGAGFFLLSLAGKAGKSEGGGDGRTGEGSEEICWAGDDHVGRYSIFFTRVRNLDDS